MVSRIACPTDADLHRLIDGSAPEREADGLTAHLDGCEICRTRLDRLAGGGGAWAVLQALADHTTLAAPDREEGEPVPAAIGPYQILGRLGQGGMGRVYKAYDPALRRVVAVKVMARELAGNATARKRFLREARAAAAVCHEHVVPVHAVEEGDPVPYIVMQFVPGRSLQERLAETGPLELRAVVRIGMQAAQGLAAAHAQGITHRDVKPANILLENGVERVKLTDFGLARAADDVRVSRSGQFAGTPLYASPEQARGEEVDHRSDLFSLGAVLYELCAGAPAFAAATPMAVLKKVCDAEPKPIRSTSPDVPGWLCGVIEKLLAKDPTQRFQTAQEVADLLAQYLAHLNQPAVSPHPPVVEVPRRGSRRRRRVAFGLLALGLLVAAVIVVRVQTDHGELVIEADDGAAEVIAKRGGVTVKDVRTGRGYTVRPGRQRLDSGEYEVEVTEADSGLTFATTRFSISRGRANPIRVTFTPKQPRAGPTFAVLPPGGGDERGYNTLNEAITAAPAGATIEIRGDGPFDLVPVTLTKPLRIRAAPGRTPVVRMVPDGWKVTSKLINTTASLSLEGLEVHNLDAPPGAPTFAYITVTDHTGTAEVRVANCRFRYPRGTGFLFELNGVKHAEFRDSAFLGPKQSSWPIAVSGMRGGTLTVEGCVGSGYGVSLGRLAAIPPAAVDVLLRRNTWLVSDGAEAPVGLNQFDTSPVALPPDPAYRVRAVENVFASGGLLIASWKAPADPKPHEPADLEAAFSKVVRWEGERNLFEAGTQFLGTFSVPSAPKFARPRTKLDDWASVPNVREDGSALAPVAFARGDPHAKHRNGTLTTEDFALAASAPGDRGADVSRVGPGAPYETFRRSAGYADWDRRAGFAPESVRPWDGAFVVLSGGKEVRCSTLGEACEAAPAGATVEVRGDGPFHVMPVVLKKPLVIRAAPGTPPRLALSPLAPPFATMIETDFPLVLEGLELQRRDPQAWSLKNPPPYVVRANAAPLSLANCRFVIANEGAAVATPNAPSFEAVNCEFLSGGNIFWMGGPSASVGFGGRARVANCVAAGGGSGITLWYLPERSGASVTLERNTFWTGSPLVFQLHHKPDDAKALGFSMSGTRNLLRGRDSLFRFEQTGSYLAQSQNRRLTAAQLRELLPRLMSWRTERDVHVGGREGYFAASAFGQTYPPGSVGSGEADWRKWWGFTATEPATEAPRLAGEGLLANPGERLTEIRPDDFRVKGWDASKGPAPGADVDFVGPGPAYERWKKTPEYAEWKKRTGVSE